MSFSLHSHLRSVSLQLSLLLILLVACGKPESPEADRFVDPASPSAEKQEVPSLQVPGDSQPKQLERGTVKEGSSTFNLLLLGISQYTPISNAEVRVCSGRLWASEEVQSAFARQGSPPKEVVELQARISGDDGVVKLPLPTIEDMVVVVKNAGGWSWQQIASAEEDETIIMRIPDATSYALRVVDQDGEPAIGVPVASAVGLSLDALRMGPNGYQLSRMPDGGLFLSDMALDRRMLEDVSGIKRGEVGSQVSSPVLLFARADLLSREEILIELPPSRPDEVIEFRLPPTGSLRLEVTGVPNATGIVNIYCNTDAVPGYDSKILGVEFEGGVLEVPYIGLGLILEIELHLKGESGGRSMVVTGPHTGGEKVLATFNIDPAMAIAGRLLDSKGQPVNDDRVRRAIEKYQFEPPTMTLFGDDSWSHSQELSLDSCGNFRVVLMDPRGVDMIHAIQIAFAGKEAAWVGAIPVEPSEVGLGDIRLGYGAALLAGHVLDSNGVGIEGVELSFQVEAPSKNGGKSWEDYPGGETVSGADGSFRIPMSLESGGGRLIALHEVFAQEAPLIVEPGRMDYEVRMVEGGELFLTYSMPKGCTKNTLQPVILGVSGEIHNTPISEYVSSKLRSFRYRGLAPGVYTVGFRYRGYQELVYPVTDVVVEAGVQVQDPRLLGMNLSLGMREIELSVHDARGKAIDSVYLHVFQGKDFFSIPIQSYDHSFLAPSHAKFHLRVGASGYSAQLIEDVGENVSVQLERPHKVHFEVAAGVQLDSPTGRLYLCLYKPTTREGVDYWLMPWKPAPVDSERGYHCTIPGPGKYLLFWFPDPENWETHYITHMTILEENLDSTVVVRPPSDFGGQ